jgi:hypothetical protein
VRFARRETDASNEQHAGKYLDPIIQVIIGSGVIPASVSDRLRESLRDRKDGGAGKKDDGRPKKATEHHGAPPIVEWRTLMRIRLIDAERYFAAFSGRASPVQ